MSIRLDRYASYYEINEILNERGKRRQVLTYRGPSYCYDVDEATFRRIKLAYAAFAVGGAALYAWAALLGASSIGSAPAFYVVLPFVLLLLPLGMCAGKMVLFLFLSRKLEFPQYDRYVRRLHTWIVLCFAFSAATLLGQLVYLVLGNGGGRDALFAAAAALLAAAAALVLRLQKRYPCVES